MTAGTVAFVEYVDCVVTTVPFWLTVVFVTVGTTAPEGDTAAYSTS